MTLLELAKTNRIPFRAKLHTYAGWREVEVVELYSPTMWTWPVRVKNIDTGVVCSMSDGLEAELVFPSFPPLTVDEFDGGLNPAKKGNEPFVGAKSKARLDAWLKYLDVEDYSIVNATNNMDLKFTDEDSL